jgi:DNA anti-recombination protein RmuC
VSFECGPSTPNTEDYEVTDVSQSQEPDVLLDVNELEVDKLTLEVDDLRAHVSLMAELANLLRLSVGVDATLARVKLDIEGVEANVLLKVRLEHVRAILEKALDTIAQHPEILQTLSQTLSEAVRESLGEAQTTLAEVLDGLQVGATVDDALRERLQNVRAALDGVLQGREVVGGGEEAAPLALGEESAKDTPTPAPGKE